MITEEKINLYRKFAGDIDHVARTGTIEEKTLVNSGDWWFARIVINRKLLIRLDK